MLNAISFKLLDLIGSTEPNESKKKNVKETVVFLIFKAMKVPLHNTPQHLNHSCGWIPQLLQFN